MNLQVDSGFGGGVLHHADLFIRHEILLERFLLVRLQPGEVRLIIRVHPGHQLNVRAIFICQIPVPGLAELPVAPGPLLLAGRDMMVRYMQQACLNAMVIAADKIVIRFVSHIGRRHRDILVAGNIDACGIIHLVIRSCSNRKA
ncbi:hypothetical protein D3C75_726720 [compost metagenome]